MTPESPPGLYRPLGVDEIRVLAFDQDAAGLPLQLSLTHISRPQRNAKDPEPTLYHALSYTWGDDHPSQAQPILIDNSEVSVSPSLHQILKHLRDNAAFRTPSFCVWVDALCINQKDEAEKNIQVGRMRQTYQDASKVIVWLGDEEDQRHATGRAAAFLAEKLPPVREGQDGKTILGPEPLYLKDASNNAIMRTIAQDILRRPWWWRVWVIQEVALARSITVICDQHHFFWEHLVYVFNWMRILDMETIKVSPDAKDANPYMPNIIFKSTYRYNIMFVPDAIMPAVELLQNAASCLATNPKDMVYALLGLATDIKASADPGDSTAVLIDYRDKTPVQRVYVNFAKVHISTYKKNPGSNPLDVITFSRHGLSRLQDMPSWVPDWSKMRETSCYSLARPGTPSKERSAICPHYLFSASKGRDADISFGMDNSLCVSGIEVDRVMSAGPPVKDDEGLVEIILEWERMALGGDATGAATLYQGGRWTLSEAFDRTITAGTDVDGRQLRHEDGFLFLRNRVLSLSRLISLGLVEENGEGVAEINTDLYRSLRAIQLRALRRRFFFTASGRFGLGPMAVEPGDVVFVLLGCSVPVVLRQTWQGWSFVGETFVAGIMDGEAAYPEAPVKRLVIR